MSITPAVYNGEPALIYQAEEKRIYYVYKGDLYCGDKKISLSYNYGPFALTILNGQLHILTINRYFRCSDHYFDYCSYDLVLHDANHEVIKNYSLPDNLTADTIQCIDGVCTVLSHGRQVCQISL
jgi:hypothetical protein